MPAKKLKSYHTYRMIANAFRVRPTTHIDFGDGQPLALVQFIMALQPIDGSEAFELIGPKATKAKEIEKREGVVWLGQALLARTHFAGLPEDPPIWAMPQHGPKAAAVDMTTRTTLNQLLVSERAPFYDALEAACRDFAERWRPALEYSNVGHPFTSGPVNWRVGVFDALDLDNATQITPELNSWCYPTAETGFEFAEREARAALAGKKRAGYQRGHLFAMRAMLFNGLSQIDKRTTKEFRL